MMLLSRRFIIIAIAAALFLLVLIFLHPLLHSPVKATLDHRAPYPGPTSNLSWEKLALQIGESSLIAKAAKRSLSWEDSDRLALQSLRNNNNAFVCLLSSQSYPFLEDIITLIKMTGKVHYLKPLYLDRSEPKELVRLVMDGTLRNQPLDWTGLMRRTLQWATRATFGSSHPVYARYVEYPHKMAAVAAKMQICGKYKLGTTGIHISDSQKETAKIAEYLFNNERMKHKNNKQ